MNNALSPKYMNQGDFANISIKPPVLWVHGADDQIVSDTSLFDFGFLGQIGAVPVTLVTIARDFERVPNLNFQLVNLKAA